MVLQSLRKSVDFYKQKLDSITNVNAEQLEQLKGLPFFNWLPNLLNNHTFNHAVGLSQKNGQSYPLFD